ncbi:hypothetical protein K3495_g10644 [Podosphaera aphanis]|nr:hypothetical protein K3495_g10644 [Podosphaera aphanis]
MESSNFVRTVAVYALQKSSVRINRSQNNQFNTSYIFYMDELPVSFGPQPGRSTDGTFEKADLDRGMEILIEIVWQNGGLGSPEVIYQECATRM